MKRLIVLATSLACLPDMARSQVPARPVSGSYDYWVCKTSCADTANAIVWGKLVLVDTVIRQPIGGRFTWERNPNGCYTARKRTATPDTYAGIRDASVTEWKVDAGVVTFRLYRSPDASHTVTAQVSGNELRGVGRSAGPPGPGAPHSPDSVVARRTGDADVALCTQ